MVQLLLTSQTHRISRFISQSKNKLQSKKTIIRQQMTLNEQSWKAAAKTFPGHSVHRKTHKCRNWRQYYANWLDVANKPVLTGHNKCIFKRDWRKTFTTTWTLDRQVPHVPMANFFLLNWWLLSDNRFTDINIITKQGISVSTKEDILGLFMAHNVISLFLPPLFKLKIFAIHNITIIHTTTCYVHISQKNY